MHCCHPAQPDAYTLPRTLSMHEDFWRPSVPVTIGCWFSMQSTHHFHFCRFTCRCFGTRCGLPWLWFQPVKSIMLSLLFFIWYYRDDLRLVDLGTSHHKKCKKIVHCKGVECREDGELVCVNGFRLLSCMYLHSLRAETHPLERLRLHWKSD